LAFAQTAPVELAFLLAGDTLMYLEFAVMIRLAAGREHFQTMLQIAARLFRFAARLLRTASTLPVSRFNGLRERRTATRSTKSRSASDGDAADATTAWAVLATA
jgi:hypothetical protein